MLASSEFEILIICWISQGVLPDGREIAVKRLYLNTRQWTDQFFNEVKLVSQVQHKNLVKLLGCSVEGPESLLVYEYLCNKSLDKILFGWCLVLQIPKLLYCQVTFSFKSSRTTC